MDGKITRVRMDAEAPDLESCQRTLDQGFSVIHAALVRALEAETTSPNASVSGSYFGAVGAASFGGYGEALVFPRESAFVEEEFGSKERDGGVVYHGRRVISFEEPLVAPNVQEFAGELGSVMLTGTLTEDDRLRRIELDYRVLSVKTERRENGVWWLTVEMDPECPENRVSGMPGVGDGHGVLAQRSSTGGTLAHALSEMEEQLGYRAGGWEAMFEASPGGPRGIPYSSPPGSVDCAVRLRFGDVETEEWLAPDVVVHQAAVLAAERIGLLHPLDPDGQQPRYEIRAADGSVVDPAAPVSTLNLGQTFSAGPPR